jgi:hypothetical protein
LTLAKTFKTLALTIAFSALSQASQFTYVLDQGYTSSTAVPSGYPVVTVTDNGANDVLVSISLANLAQTEFITALVMNFNPALDANQLSILALDLTPPTVLTKGNNINGPSELNPIGTVDLVFNWASSNSDGGINRFNGPEVLNFQFTGAFNFSAADFNYANSDGFIAATHIQGIDNGPGSIKVYDGPDDPSDDPSAPEPASMMLVGAGGVALFFARKRKRA